jgi:hypothetical protein
VQLPALGGGAAVQVDLGLSPVYLSFTRIMLKRDCHLRLPRTLLADVLANAGLAALEAELAHQPLIDATSSVALLRWALLVFVQAAVNDCEMGTQDRPQPRSLAPVDWRAWVL